MSSRNAFAILAVLAALLLFAGCVGQAGTPQSIVAASNLFYENGQAYIQTTALLNTPAELYASNVPGFNGISLGAGQYANATGKVTILVTQTKRNCVYPLVAQTDYVGGIFGLGAVKVTDYIPANPTKDFSYDVSVNGAQVATGLSPFTTSEVPINLPFNTVLAQTPVMKIAGLDASAGSQQCPSASDFIIIQIADTPEVRLINSSAVGQVRIFLQSVYYNQKSNILGGNYISPNYNVSGFDAVANKYTYPNQNVGSGSMAIKVPLGAFNIVTYKPPAAGQAQLTGQCTIQDAQASQQTNLQFTYKNIGAASVFSYAVGGGKYIYASGDTGSGAQVASGDSRTVNMRVTPNSDAAGTNVLPITISGESGISTQITCLGNILQGTTPNPQPLPIPQPGPLPPSTQCKFYEKSITKTVGQVSIFGINFGGTQVGSCALDLNLVGSAMAVFGFLIVVLGFVMMEKDDDVGRFVALLGGLLLVVGIGMVFLQIVIDSSGQLLWAGIGVGILALVAAFVMWKIGIL